ncbi:alpha/beta hydrolase [Aliiglaciecola litoralis]|uniref:Serine aminopeptidase S33 domain-containing protein n=1 Tax=Aliiglaciecola litoralis TaxID=582857 RepID=A0ABP3X3D9_9ALTE
MPNIKGLIFRIKTLLVAISLLVMSGCTSFGSHVLSNPSIYMSQPSLLNVEPEQLGIDSRKYCIDYNSSCVHYLFAEAYQAHEFPENANVYYNLHATGNNVENVVSYKATPENFNRINGTAVLLHGFGASKEAMMAMSIYFRSIGMDIIALDLFGHGQSEQEFVFGAKEHTLFTRLIEEVVKQNSLSEPLILVGHSMGALPASNVLIESSAVDGAILLAPMIRFDYAAKQYLAYKNSTLSEMFSDYMDGIVSKSMADKNVSLQDTNIPMKIKSVRKPILIINSDVDSISPYKHFSHLENHFIQLEMFRGRSHPSLVAFDFADTKIIENWISKNFPTALSKVQSAVSESL